MIKRKKSVMAKKKGIDINIVILIIVVILVIALVWGIFFKAPVEKSAGEGELAQTAPAVVGEFLVPLHPDDFNRFGETIRYITGSDGMPVKNPFTNTEMDSLLGRIKLDMAKAAKTDPFAKNSVGHMQEHFDLFTKNKKKIMDMGIDSNYYRLLFETHDMGKFVPDKDVLRLAAELYKVEDVWIGGHVYLHDESTATYLLKVGKELNIPEEKMLHIIKDIMGHNDGSGLAEVWWNRVAHPGGNYPLPERLEGNILAYFDRYGQGSVTGAEKILRQNLEGGMPFEKAFYEAFVKNPKDTIKQLDVLVDNIGKTVDGFKDSPMGMQGRRVQQETLRLADTVKFEKGVATVMGSDGKVIIKTANVDELIKGLQASQIADQKLSKAQAKELAGIAKLLAEEGTEGSRLTRVLTKKIPGGTKMVGVFTFVLVGAEIIIHYVALEENADHKLASAVLAADPFRVDEFVMLFDYYVLQKEDPGSSLDPINIDLLGFINFDPEKYLIASSRDRMIESAERIVRLEEMIKLVENGQKVLLNIEDLSGTFGIGRQDFPSSHVSINDPSPGKITWDSGKVETVISIERFLSSPENVNAVNYFKEKMPEALEITKEKFNKEIKLFKDRVEDQRMADQFPDYKVPVSPPPGSYPVINP